MAGKDWFVSPEGARTVAALHELALALAQTGAELQALGQRATTLAADLTAGAPLAATMAAEPRPLIITRLADITEQLHEVSGAVRRAEARQLRAEGFTHEQIAAEFGVSRQRAAALLKASRRRAARLRQAGS